MKKKENKIYIAMIILLIILLIISSQVKEKKEEEKQLSNNYDVIITNAQKESNSVKEKEKKDFIEINTDIYLNYYSSNEKKAILIARPTCSYCQIAEPIIQNIAYKYNLDINYLNTDNFKEGDEEKLITSDDYFNEGFGTPLLMIVGNKKIIDKVDGLTDREHYIEFFKKNKMLK